MSGKKTLTADEILAMSSSDENDSEASSSSSHSSEKQKKKDPKTARSLETTPLAKQSFTQPDPVLSKLPEETKSSFVEVDEFQVIEQPIVINPYINPQTSKSANAVEQSFAARITSEANELANRVAGGIDKVTDSITDVLFKKEDA